MGKEYTKKRSQKIAFNTIEKMCEKYGISKNVCEKAKKLYLEAQDKKLISSRGTKVMVAALVVMAAGLLKEKIDIEKIEKESGASEKSFDHEYHSLLDGLVPE